MSVIDTVLEDKKLKDLLVQTPEKNEDEPEMTAEKVELVLAELAKPAGIKSSIELAPVIELSVRQVELVMEKRQAKINELTPKPVEEKV